MVYHKKCNFLKEKYQDDFIWNFYGENYELWLEPKAIFSQWNSLKVVGATAHVVELIVCIMESL